MGANDGKNKGGWEQSYNCSTTLLSMVISSLNFREACHGNLVQQKCWSENIVQLQVLGPSDFMTQVSIKLLVYNYKA